MFTRKYYEAIAEVVKGEANPAYGSCVTRTLVDRFADLFEKDDPRFDRDRFLAACGLGD